MVLEDLDSTKYELSYQRKENADLKRKFSELQKFKDEEN